MHRKGFLGAVAGATLALFVAFAPVMASAAGDADVVVFRTGRANANVCWVLNGCGSTLTYNFTTAAAGGVCLGASTDGTAADTELPSGVNQNNCRIDSVGTFTNIVCGTGLVNGGATTVDELSGDGASPEYNVASYTIVFVAGVGVVESTAVSDAVDGGNGSAAGVVNIVPADSTGGVGPFHSAPGAANLCVDGFSVNSVLATNA